MKIQTIDENENTSPSFYSVRFLVFIHYLDFVRFDLDFRTFFYIILSLLVLCDFMELICLIGFIRTICD